MLLVIGLGSTLYLMNPVPVIEIPEYNLFDSNINNPNLRLGKPIAENNAMVFFNESLNIDTNQDNSTWSLAQWSSPDPILPNTTLLQKNDPLLGDSLYYTNTSTTELAIYNAPPQFENVKYTYELKETGGIEKAEGGMNLFLSTELNIPFQLHNSLIQRLAFKILDLTSIGEPPGNVGQIFLGYVFRCNNTQSRNTDILFLQIMIANTHDATFYAAGNPSVKTGIFAKPLPDGLQQVVANSDDFHKSKFDLVPYIEEALEITYYWEEDGIEKEKSYTNKNITDWALSSMYFGLETQGNTTATLQVTDFNIGYSDSFYFQIYQPLNFIAISCFSFAAVILVVIEIIKIKMNNQPIKQ